MACCRSLSTSSSHPSYSSVGIGHTDGAYLFVSADNNNETAVWGLPEAGECLKCFRTTYLNNNKDAIAPLPHLTEVKIPRHPYAPVFFPNNKSTTTTTTTHSVRALLGRVSFSSTSYVITGGTDKSIR